MTVLFPPLKNHLLTPRSGNPPEQAASPPAAYPKMKYAKGEPWREKAVMNAEQEKALGEGWHDTPTALAKALADMEKAAAEAEAATKAALATAEAELKSELAKSKAPEPKLQAASLPKAKPLTHAAKPPANLSPEPAKAEA